MKNLGEIAELKTGLKYETHFNTLTENIKTETLIWGIDNNILVPAGGQIEASVIIEELSFGGGYTIESTMSGMVSVTISRVKDGVTVLPISFNIATIFQHFLSKADPRIKSIASMDKNLVRLTSKGICHFQVFFDLKNRYF